MFLVGLTGGIATGKSTVSKVFTDNGIPLVDADAIARQIVEPGKPAWKKLKAAFGDKIFQSNGELDRKALSQIVFDDSEKRKILNSITHPEIHRTIRMEVIKYFFLGHNFIVVDLPLLFETGFMLPYVYKIITVTCEEDIQLTRLMDRNSLSEAEAKKRISAQLSLDEKCEKSHFIIENSGTILDTQQQTLKILNILLESNHHWKLRGIILATAAVCFSGIAWLINYKYKIISE